MKDQIKSNLCINDAQDITIKKARRNSRLITFEIDELPKHSKTPDVRRNQSNQSSNFPLTKPHVRGIESLYKLDPKHGKVKVAQIQNRDYQAKNTFAKFNEGQKKHHDNYKQQNLNLNQNLSENYKQFPDKLYKTKKRIENNRLLSPKVSSAKDEEIIMTKDQLQPDKRYTNNSKIDYYLNYKLLDNINDEYTLKDSDPDQNTAQLNKCKSSMQLPTSVGLLRNQSTPMILNGSLSRQLEPIIDSLKYMPANDYPLEIDLTNNNLKDDQAQKFIDQLKNKLERFSLKNNKIGKKTIDRLIFKIQDEPLNQLKYLNLDGLKINDHTGKLLVKSLHYASDLRHLVLNNNYLSTQTGDALADLCEDLFIRSLELHNNQFRGSDLIKFFANLSKYTCMEFLDVSWNKIGMSKDAIKILFDNLAHNTSINHFDLSQNEVSADLYPLISSSLKKNHSILCFHFIGNPLVLDIDGNVALSTTATPFLSFQSENTREVCDNMSKFSKPNLANTWICEKFTPFEIVCKGSPNDELKPKVSVRESNQEKVVPIRKFKAKISAEQFIKDGKITLSNEEIKMEDPLFIHWEFDDWRPWQIKGKSGSFKSTFMVPPGRWKFFFTTQLKQFMLSREYEQEKVLDLIKMKFTFDKNRPEVTTNTIEIRGYNIIEVQLPTEPFDYHHCPIKPRNRIIWEFSDVVMKWSIPISIWAKWIKDDQEQSTKCFENDWELAKERLPKALKEDDQEKSRIKHRLTDKYQLIRWLYKYQSSNSSVSGIWCISETGFNDIFVQMNYQNEFFTIAMPPIIFRETVTSDKNAFGTLSPSNGCVRHQFLAFIIKCAVRKQKIEPRANITYEQAVKMFIEEYEPYLTAFDPSKWRWDRYQNESVDAQFKKLMPAWDKICEKQMGNAGPNGSKSLLTLEVFTKFIKDLELTPQTNVELFGQYFNQSLQVSFNEVQNDFHTKIRHKLELFEAFSRMADACNFIQCMENVKQPSSPYSELDLGDKLWCLTPLMMKNVFSVASKSERQIIEEIKTAINSVGIISIDN